MNHKNRLTLTSVLNMLLVFCLLRFGLVFTAGFSLFDLSYVVLVGIGILFIYALVSKRYLGRLLQTSTWFLLLNILLVVIAKEVTTRADYISTASNYINQLIVLLLLWGFYLYMQMLDICRRRKLVAVYLIAVAISAAYTFYVAMNGSDRVIRNTAFGEYDPSFPLVYGGFDFIYGLVIVYVVLLVVLTEGKGRITQRIKVCLIALLSLIAVTIIASGFSTAFALILIFTILNVPQKTYTKVFWILLMAFSVFVIPQQLVKLIESIPYMPEITSSRINELILSFTGQASSDYITDNGQRVDRFFWSLQAFAEHPLLGVVAGRGESSLGYHTEWIDQLARYGLPATICNALFWLGTYWNIERTSRGAPLTQKCIKCAFGMYLLLGFLNPISMVVTSAPLFVLCPFVENLFIVDDGRRINECE